MSLESADNLEAAAKDLRLIELNDSDLLNVLTLCCFSSFPHTEDDTIPPFDMNMSDFFSYAYWFKQVFSMIKAGMTEKTIYLISFLNFGNLKNDIVNEY